jgi:hypothetical protein
MLGFLLEHMQHIDHIAKLRGIDGAIRSAAIALDNFHHASAAKTFQRLGRRIGRALLRGVERLADVAAHLIRHCA